MVVIGVVVETALDVINQFITKLPGFVISDVKV